MELFRGAEVSGLGEPPTTRQGFTLSRVAALCPWTAGLLWPAAFFTTISGLFLHRIPDSEVMR